MNKVSSVYIHLLRILAALGVFLSHISLPYFSNWTFFRGLFGHNCVVVFFVLSGFLIAYTQAKNKKSAVEYAKDRFVRLYSVIVPALLVTYLLDGIGLLCNKGLYLQFLNPDFQGLKFVVNLLSLQQTLFFNSNPSSNGVFWSLSYEFWYYVFYGCVMYLHGKTRWMVLIPLLVFMGPKIVVLLPLWYLGVLCFRYSDKFVLPRFLSLSLFLVTSTLVVAGCFHNTVLFAFFGKLGTSPLYYSAYFASDYVYGLVVFLNLFFLMQLKLDRIQVKKEIMKYINIVATATFPLYAFHFPMLLFISSFFPFDRLNNAAVLGVVLVIVVLSIILSVWIEKTKAYYEVFFMYVLKKMQILNFNKA